MKTQFIQFRRDAAHLLLPQPDTVPGELPDGSIICAIDECPDGLPPERLLRRLQGLFPTPGTSRIRFADLPERDGGCCGGHCGG
ncbi:MULTISPECIES: hypothetical protein [unclassified Azospirillum]|uniref:hypothetical protein n=1 Tax=unclassified Azospirillum TaxID=2630922 RepID=UPI000B6BF04D|nr:MULTISPECIES: hypothetical protein [unclassified Azospirillum]SNT01562.1 hypothetical protein SAMN05880556_1195 [Azospirillum sp. RU38E]SNT17481.1 hypothetical protein SAMN05880591_1195 [Azospirillum sp. RU37A]